MDVDALCDGKDVYIGGIMEHIEEAGIHSGDSACLLPPQNLSKNVLAKVRQQTSELAFALNVVGLMNIQFAIREDKVYLLEVNPRGSQPFLSLLKLPVCLLRRWHRWSWPVNHWQNSI